MSKFNPQDAVIAVTYQCNSRCRMCDIWRMKNYGDFFRPEDLLNLPENLKSVNLSGGEPFLRQDLPEIIKIVKKKCPQSRVIISSNGFASELILAQMKKIVEIDPEIGVAISIDGIGPIHDAIRNIEGGYEKALATLKGLKSLGLKHLKIGFTLGDYNLEELAKVYALAQELSVEFSFAFVHSSENYFGKINEIRKREEMAKKIDWLVKKELAGWNPKRWARAYFAYGAKKFIQNGKRILPDYSGELNIFIDPYGHVFPCDVSPQKIGELKNLGQIKKAKKEELCSASWMICTARQAIKKHFIQAIIWIIEVKIKNIFTKYVNK